MLSIPYYCYCCQQIVAVAILFNFLSNQISYGNQLIYVTAQKFRDENSTSGYCLGYLSTFVCRYNTRICRELKWQKRVKVCLQTEQHQIELTGNELFLADALNAILI